MPRRERPLDPDGDALSQFARGLRGLREKAGNPTYRELARRAHYAAGTLSDAAGGRKLPTLAVTLAYVRACEGDVARWEKAWHALAAELAAESAEPDKPEPAADAPYVGLGAFQTEDAYRFFGRERVLDELDGKLGRHRFLAVFGASGAGKSSLLRAGFVPRRADSAVLLFSPGSDPFEECALQLAPLLGSTATQVLDELTSAPDNLRLLLRQAGRDRATVVVDQFEELFTLCADPAERTAFLDALLAAVSATAEVVIGVRADFYPRCAEHRGLAKAVSEAQLLLGPMTGAELREAIVKPATQAGLSVEGSLVTELVAEAHAEPGVLPLLSHALLETWRRRRGATLALSGYHATGGIRGALANTAEAEYSSLDEAEQTIAEQLFLRLIDLGKDAGATKRRVRRDELDRADPRVDFVLDRLAGSRLTTLDATTVELTHEALIDAWPRLRDWLTENRAGLQVHRQLTAAAAAWEEMDREPDALARGTRLAIARDWAETGHSTLTPREREFLHASLEAEHTDRRRTERRTRRLQILVALLAVLLLLSTSTTLYALHLQQVATDQQNLATSRQLAAEARTFMSIDPAHAAQLALTAYRTAPTDDARDALLSAAAARDQSFIPLRVIDSTTLALNHDGSIMASLDERSIVELWAMPSRQELGALPLHFGSRTLIKFGGAGNLLTVTDEAGVRLVDVTDPRHPVERFHFPHASYPEISPAGDLLAANVRGLATHLYDITDPGHPRELMEFPAIDRMLFHPNGHTLLDQKLPPRILPSQWWNARPGSAPEPGPQLLVNLSFPTAFSTDGRLLVTTDAQPLGKTRFWDIHDAGHPRELPSPDLGPWHIAPVFSSDSRSMAVFGDDQNIRVVDLTNPTDIRITATLTGHIGSVLAMAFSSDSHHLISAGSDSTLRQWDTDIGAVAEQVARTPH